MKKICCIVLGAAMLFTCDNRTGPVSQRDNPYDSGGENWKYNGPPAITAAADSRWFDYDHATRTGAIRLAFRASDPNQPHDTFDCRMYICGNNCRAVVPENDSVCILSELAPGIAWRCSLHVYDTREGYIDTVIPILLPGKVPPPPPAPALSIGDTAVIINWKAVAGATGYSAYRADNAVGPFILAGTITQPADSAVSYSDRFDTYSSRFYIIASGNDAGECRSRDTLFCRRYSDALPAPIIDSVSKGVFTDHIRVCLHTNDSTTSRFEIYRSFSPDGVFKPVASFPAVNSTMCFDDYVATGTVIHYKAAALDPQGLSGPLSASDYGFIQMDRTAAVIIADGLYDHNALYWNAVPGVRHYAVYRSADGCRQGMNRIAVTTACIYRDSLAPNDKSFYTVSTIDSLGNEVAMSNCIAVGKGRVPGPSGFAVSDGMYRDSIVLSWDPVPGTGSYIIYRSSTSCPKFDDTLARATRPNFSDTVSGTGYYFYTVSAVDNSGRTGLMSICGRGTTSPSPAPGNLKASFETDPDVISVSWNMVAETGYYTIYRSSTSCSSEMVKIDSTPSNAYTDTVSSSGVYYYRVAAVDRKGNEGSRSDCGQGRVKPLPAPAGVRASNGTYIGRIRVSWEAVVGADGYIIYKGSSNVAAASVPIDTVTALYKFDDEPAAPLHYYWVAARNALGAGTRSGYVYGRVLTPPELTLLNDSGPVILAWNTDTAINRTYIYRINDATTESVCIDSTPTSPLTVTLPDYDTYTLMALVKTAAGDSCYTNSVTASLSIPALTGLTANLAEDGIHLRWNAVPGISIYYIYRSTSAEVSMEDGLDFTSDTSYIDNDIVPDRYYYRVAAANPPLRSSALSDTVSIEVVAPPVLPAADGK